MDSVPSRAAASTARPLRLLIAIGLFWMGLYLYIPILTPYVVRQGGTAGLAGLVVAAYGLPQLLCRISIGIWADRLGRLYPFMIAGFILIAVSSLGMAILPVPDAFIVFRILAGLAASTWAMFTIAYSNAVAANRTASAMGWVSFANSVGQVVAAVIGGFLAERWGWASPFWASIGLALIGIVVMGPPHTPPRSRPSRAAQLPWTRVLRLHSVRSASTLGIFLQAITFITTYGYTPLFAAHEGLSRTALGMLTAAGMIPTIVMTVVTGSWLSRWLATPRLLFLSYLGMALSSGVTPFVGAGWGLYTSQAVLGLARGVASPLLMAWTIRDADQTQRTTAMATYQSLYAIGMIFGPAIASRLVAHWGLTSPFYFAAALGMTGTFAAAMLRQHASLDAAVAPSPKSSS